MSPAGYILWPLVGGVAALFLLCAGMWAGHKVRDALAEVRQAFGEGKARGQADADGWMARRHRPDCACDPCWDRHCERLVRDFDWDAAEDDFLRRQP